MSDLIERLEKATGLDRDLDMAIARACPREGWRIEHDGSVSAFDGEGWYSMPTEVPFYTHSIDAALTLAEGRPYSLRSLPTRCEARVGPKKGDGYVLKGGEHKCAAIALCIAALRARTELSSTLQGEK